MVCNDTEPGLPRLLDTDAVPLSRRGHATFSGRLDLPAICTDEPEDIVFLLRIAQVRDHHVFLLDRWIAFGGVRTVRDLNDVFE